MNIGQALRAASRPTISLEFFPPAQEEQLADFYATADRLASLQPLFASVTYGAGGSRQHSTLQVTSELARRGWCAMAHLTCVGAQPESIDGFLDSLQQAGVNNVLALRGDPPAGAVTWDWEQGTFRHAVDLVRHIRKTHSDMGIGVAAYPAPHPESLSFSADRRHLTEKIMAGADFAITQLFFDVREYLDLVERLRTAGCDVPVLPGILPIQSFASLRRVLSLCGACIPGKLYLALEEADARGGVEAVREVGLRFAIDQIRRLVDAGAPGIHLYTLNKADMCLRLVSECGL